MASPSSQKKPVSSRPNLLLPGTLCGVIVAYLALQPWLHQVSEETRRSELRTQSHLREASRLLNQKNELYDLEKQVTQNPSDVQAQMSLAQRLEQLGRLPEAMKRAEVAAGLGANSLEPMLLLADIQKRSRRYDLAIQTYKAILLKSPGEGRAIAGLSVIYSTLAWPQEALALLEPAVKASPSNLQLRVPLAMAYMQQSNFSAAEQQLLTIRSRAPREAVLWSPLVEVYLASSQYPKAVETARDAIDLLPSDPTLPLELGKAYMALNDLENARAAFQKTLALDPENIPARYQLALYHQRTNHIVAAIEELEHVRKLAPNYERTGQVLGQLYLQNGRPEEGRQLLAEDLKNTERGQKMAMLSLRVSSHPSMSEAHLQIAQAYMETKDYALAKVELDKTLELAPNNDIAKRLLASLPATESEGR